MTSSVLRLSHWDSCSGVKWKSSDTPGTLSRETPLSLPDLRNMVLCAEAGAMILPAMPAFYQLPKTIDDLADFLAGKILNALGFDQQLFPAWTGKVGGGS